MRLELIWDSIDTLKSFERSDVCNPQEYSLDQDTLSEYAAAIAESPMTPSLHSSGPERESAMISVVFLPQKIACNANLGSQGEGVIQIQYLKRSRTVSSRGLLHKTFPFDH